MDTLSTSSSRTLSPEALRNLSVNRRGIPPILKAVRSTYRSQRRRPQLESTFVYWIERFLRKFPNEPVGRLALLHVQTFFDQLTDETDLSDERRIQARKALRFLRTEVLQSPPSP